MKEHTWRINRYVYLIPSRPPPPSIRKGEGHVAATKELREDNSCRIMVAYLKRSQPVEVRVGIVSAIRDAVDGFKVKWPFLAL